MAKKVKKEAAKAVKMAPAKSSGAGPPGSSGGAGGPNEALALCFDELCAAEGGRGFKANAYKKVAKVLRDAPKVESGEEAGKMAGIGKSSALKIQEFLDTGTMAKLEEIRSG